MSLKNHGNDNVLKQPTSKQNDNQEVQVMQQGDLDISEAFDKVTHSKFLNNHITEKALSTRKSKNNSLLTYIQLLPLSSVERDNINDIVHLFWHKSKTVILQFTKVVDQHIKYLRKDIALSNMLDEAVDLFILNYKDSIASKIAQQNNADIQVVRNLYKFFIVLLRQRKTLNKSLYLDDDYIDTYFQDFSSYRYSININVKHYLLMKQIAEEINYPVTQLITACIEALYSLQIIKKPTDDMKWYNELLYAQHNLQDTELNNLINIDAIKKFLIS